MVSGVLSMPTVGERGSRGSCKKFSGVFSTTIGVLDISAVGDLGSMERIRFLECESGGESCGTASWLLLAPIVYGLWYIISE